MRLNILPVCNTCRWEDQRTLLGIRQGNREQAELAAARRVGFKILDRSRYHLPGLARAVQAPDQHHSGGGGRSARNHQRFDGFSTGAQADDSVLGGHKVTCENDRRACYASNHWMIVLRLPVEFACLGLVEFACLGLVEFG